jgi:hypothetical protein
MAAQAQALAQIGRPCFMEPEQAGDTAFFQEGKHEISGKAPVGQQQIPRFNRQNNGSSC